VPNTTSHSAKHFTARLRQLSPLVSNQILAPANDILDNFVRDVVRGGAVDDPRFIELGVRRVISQSASGRDFIQQAREVQAESLARSTFFDALHSRRRLDILANLNTELMQRRAATLPDLLANFPALKKLPIYAVDGHHIEHPTHSARDQDSEFVSSNSLYVLCLHSGLLMNMGAVQGNGIRRHEMPVFRQRLADWIVRHRDARGTRPILVLDPAFVDNDFWSRMQILSQGGAQVITRMKENMKPHVMSVQTWDKTLAVNQGVSCDEWIGFANSCLMRRVRYVDPESGIEYEFLTTVKDLAPGLIALLYLLRWRIEKIFDTGKNKLEEKKAWATGTVAHEIQAHFMALTQNLMLLLREDLRTDEGIVEVKVEQKRMQALKERTKRATAAGRSVAVIQKLLPAIVQLTAQFIRTLRNGILTDMRWADALPHLRRSMETYL